MNRQSYLTIAVAVCCIAAAGVSASTLTSSLDQDPDDVIDLDYKKLPLGKDSGRSVKRAVQNDGGGNGGSQEEGDSEGSSGDSGESDSSSSEGSSGEGASSSRKADEGTPGDSGGDSTGDAGGGAGDTGDSGDRGSQPGEDASGTGDDGKRGLGTGDVSTFSLLDLLPWLLLLVALVLAYRYRRNLLALALAVAGVFGGGRSTDESTTRRRWPTETPSNEVHRAWLGMVERLDVDRPYARTPSECAEAAVRADMDPEAVETLTDTFEEVRYGERPVTDERRRRARESLDRLGRGGGTL